MNYQSSLSGFHNPYKHKGFTPAKFLYAYIDSQKKRFRKKGGVDRRNLVECILENWDDQQRFVKRLFPNTLI